MNPLYLMLPDLLQVSLSAWLISLSVRVMSLSVQLMAMSVPDGPAAESLTAAERLIAADRSAARRQHSAIVKMKLFII